MEYKILIKLPDVVFGYSKRTERALIEIEKILRDHNIPFDYVGNSGKVFSVKGNRVSQLDSAENRL